MCFLLRYRWQFFFPEVNDTKYSSLILLVVGGGTIKEKKTRVSIIYLRYTVWYVRANFIKLTCHTSHNIYKVSTQDLYEGQYKNSEIAHSLNFISFFLLKQQYNSSVRFAMSSSRRMSFGGSALRDSSTVLNSRSSSVSRRTSLGGSKAFAETPAKDRRALLDEWRRGKSSSASRTRDHETAMGNNSEDGVEKPVKRSRTNEAPPLPPSGSHGFSTEGSTALERIRMRKALRMQQQLNEEQYPNNSFQLTDEHDDLSTISGGFMGGTPRRMGNSNRRQSILIPPQRRGSSSSVESEQTQPISQLTVDSQEFQKENTVQTGSVEDAGLRSQVREMQLRVDQLEKEKMVLSMAKAPLEARFRQREDMWGKEQHRLLTEIDDLKQTNLSANERNRDLEGQIESLEEECRHLRMEVRKASSSLSASTGDGTAWSQRIQDNKEIRELQEKLRHAEEEIDSLRLAKISIEKELHATKIELEALARSYDELQTEYDEIEHSSSNNREAEIKLEHLTTEHIATSAQLNAVCADLAATKARSEATLEEKEREHKEQIEQMNFQMSILKTRAETAKIIEEGNDKPMEEDDSAVLKAYLEERDRRIVELEKELLKGEEIRRQMHNKIQELRGNVRVFVRTRPFLPNDKQSSEPAIDVSPDGESLSISDLRSGGTVDFKFDKVFPPSSGQDIVFQEVSDFVQSALDGYHVCLFSYGQTGSGKTHTMQGSGNGAMRGIIPRAVEQILSQARIMQHQRWDFKVSASFLEIYNEELKDLLLTMDGNASSTPNSQKLAIKRNRDGKSFVEGLTEVAIETLDSNTGMEQLEALMKVAARARSVASTNMNAQSSRSHSVFMLNLRGYNAETGAEVHGALNLCDLAGSERLDRSGANADAKRLRETQAINKSLSCLGDVFNALGNRASHIPYRNSKLTYLLQDCLSGDGKALMFVNLSPTTASSGESLCSLRFAQRVNQVELGKPTKNIQYKNR